MSQGQIDAIALLCRMLQSTAKDIAGPLLSDLANQPALTQLRREQLIGFGEPLNWLHCPQCSVDMARVVRELPDDQVLLLCAGECGDFEAPRSVRQTTLVNVERVVGHLAMGLNLNRHLVDCVVPDLVWRLGMTEQRRGKPVSWYFARHLNRDATAQILLTHLTLHRTDRSARILTSSLVPLPASSPLVQYHVVYLPDVMRLSQNRFEFFADRMMAAEVTNQLTEPAVDRGTTLRHVRTERKAYVDGIAYPLEAMQANILLALMDDYDHRMEGNALRAACGSDADRFSPIKFFGRNPLIYKTFVRYIHGDKEYALAVPNGDCDWLT